ncbi:glycoside hydrolase family 16 protein [Olivibacter sp. SDN3]|nr:glycoside hydrolase family 16 protein [Olivibacter sp. SDN3]
MLLLCGGFWLMAEKPYVPLVSKQKAPIWKLQWADEFNVNGLPDSNFWSYDIGGHGWGNNELQHYTAADTFNAKIQDGVLLLRAQKKKLENRPYTSARLVTKNKVDMKYGKLEVRAKLPKGRGLWPAIWMLPTDRKYGGWPKSGEIDIMEHVGFKPDTVYGSVHTDRFNHIIGTEKTCGIAVEDPYNIFHVYTIVWNERFIDFLLDGQQFYRFENSNMGYAEWPFDQSFHLLMNIAVGGNWGGQQGIDEDVFPATMQIDYVRYYTLN